MHTNFTFIFLHKSLNDLYNGLKIQQKVQEVDESRKKVNLRVWIWIRIEDWNENMISPTTRNG